MEPTPNTPGTKPKTPLFKTSELQQIILILVLATITLFAIGVLFRYNEALATTLLTSVGMHAAGARAPAVLLCLVRGVAPLPALLFNFYIEVIIVVLCYYVFVLVIREGLETKFLRMAAKQAESAAQKHRTRLKRYEHVGLFFLVMAPLPMTGPVTGAIVGYLLNFRPWVTFSIVLSGTFCALGAYVLLGQTVLSQLIAFQRQYQDNATVVIGVVIAAITIYHVRSIAALVKEISESSDDKKDPS